MRGVVSWWGPLPDEIRRELHVIAELRWAITRHGKSMLRVRDARTLPWLSDHAIGQKNYNSNAAVSCDFSCCGQWPVPSISSQISIWVRASFCMRSIAQDIGWAPP
jgi:hypothetical protein